jgi:hypothetical protein
MTGEEWQPGRVDGLLGPEGGSCHRWQGSCDRQLLLERCDSGTVNSRHIQSLEPDSSEIYYWPCYCKQAAFFLLLFLDFLLSILLFILLFYSSFSFAFYNIH